MKGTKTGMQREIVGEIVEAGGEQQHAALADFLVEQQRRLVGQAATTREFDGSTRTA